MEKLRLYHYWRSTSSWRVRWAFALKNIPCEFVPINLLTDESDEAEHTSRNPMGYVPVLEFLDRPEPRDAESKAKRFLSESTAIIEWADELFPEPKLLPGSADQRAQIRRLSEIVNSGIQPLQSFNVALEYSDDAAQRMKWAQRWIRKGLHAYSAWTEGTSGKFSVGDEITMADLFLIPQCYAAMRQEIDLGREFPRLARIYENSLNTSACQAAHPDRYQPV